MAVPGRPEINWDQLDKRKFFVYGAGIFTSLTTSLFPLTVIKTRMQALEGAPQGLRGSYFVARDILRHDGVRGLYKGFGTVVFGMIPARGLYLSVLEVSKANTSQVLQRFQLSDTVVAGASAFVAGATASLAGQLVVVPIDVVSQRLMIMGGGPSSSTSGSSSMQQPRGPAGPTSTSGSAAGMRSATTAAAMPQRINGLQLAREIVRQEGVPGLYRGLGASVATFVPSSAIWWSAYSAWQKVIWHQVWRVDSSSRVDPSEGTILGVQLVAGVLTGCTSALLTNPLDLVKTRLQTAALGPDGKPPTWTGIAGKLAREEGFSGFLRGVTPRMTSTAIWGTAMVSSYEFLKRLCALPMGEQQ